MSSVFLSYSREDVAKAEAVASALERLGHSVWWDRRVQGGSRFSRDIEEALKSADAVVVLWSPASVQSGWVTDEAAEGRDTGRLVPIVIDDIKPPLGFRQYQSIDLSGWKGHGRNAAIGAVHEAILARSQHDEGAGAPVDMAPTKRQVGRTPVRLGIATLALIAIFAAGLVYWLTSTSTRAEGPSLQLQLGNFGALSGEVPRSVPQTLREEILSALATDAAILASADKPAPGAGPAYALTGTVGEAEKKLRFNVHLVDSRTGTTVWTTTLERPVSAAELAPRQVAIGVSGVLRCGLGGAARYREPLPDQTLSLYMNFCEEYRAEGLGKLPNMTRALDMAHRVVAAAPHFSNGWSGLAMVARIAGNQALQREAQSAAQRALSLDEQNSEGYQALALVQPPFAFAAREPLHIKSITVRPSDCGCEYVSYAGFLNRVGRQKEALNAYERAHDMMPLAPDVASLLADSLLVTGNVRQANDLVSDVRKVWPNDPEMRWTLLRSAFWTRHYDGLAEALADPDVASDEVRSALAIALKAMQSGAPAAKAKAIDTLQTVKAEGLDGALVVSALAALGAHDKALTMAERLILKNTFVLPVLFEPPLAPARDSPQFAGIVQRLGLVSYWRQSRHKPDFCHEASPPGLCASL